MLANWMSRLAKARLAETPEERESIYRFRYEIYVEELAREIGGVDHERRTVSDEDDEKEHAIHLYVGSAKRIDGALRLCTWDPGKVPAGHQEKLSLEMFPGIDKLRIAELGRLMIRPSMRGRLILPSLMREGYVLLMETIRTDMVFCYCRPGLIHYYRKLGARPYPGRLAHEPEGMEVPLVSVLSDYAYFKHVGSPLASLVRRYFGPGKRRPLDLAPYEELFDRGLTAIETDAGRIWDLMQTEFLEAQKGRSSILESLSEPAIRSLSAQGLVMEVPEGTLVTREGHAEKEMYFILEGSFEAFSGDCRFQVMTKGDVFGEVAFFREGGQRSASVRALTDGRLLCLRRRFIDELVKRDPETALTILYNLGRVLSDRLVSVDKMLLKR